MLLSRRRMLRFTSALAAFVVVSLSALVARADPPTPAASPGDPKRGDAEAAARSGVQIAPIFGVGVHATRLVERGAESERFNAQGFGWGLRAGYVFALGPYVGLAFVSHVGESRLTPNGMYVDAALGYGGAEIGHQLAAGPVWIRPYGGVGLARATMTAPISGRQVDASGDALGSWLGATALLPIPELSRSFFAGIDARYLAVLGVKNGASVDGVMFAVTGGHKF
jgi:hypothetical protein